MGEILRDMAPKAALVCHTMPLDFLHCTLIIGRSGGPLGRQKERCNTQSWNLQIVPVKSLHPVVLVYQNLENVQVYSEPML